jgi:hypothetical protein
MALDLADCHATRIEAQDLVVETVEPRLSFRDQLRLEAANAVARDGNLDLAIVGQDRLRTRPIAAVATASTVGIALLYPRCSVSSAPSARSINAFLSCLKSPSSPVRSSGLV